MSNPFKIGQKPIQQFQAEAKAWDEYKKQMPDFFRIATQKERWQIFRRLYWRD